MAATAGVELGLKISLDALLLWVGAEAVVILLAIAGLHVHARVASTPISYKLDKVAIAALVLAAVFLIAGISVNQLSSAPRTTTTTVGAGLPAAGGSSTTTTSSTTTAQSTTTASSATTASSTTSDSSTTTASSLPASRSPFGDVHPGDAYYDAIAMVSWALVDTFLNHYFSRNLRDLHLALLG